MTGDIFDPIDGLSDSRMDLSDDELLDMFQAFPGTGESAEPYPDTLSSGADIVAYVCGLPADDPRRAVWLDYLSGFDALTHVSIGVDDNGYPGGWARGRVASSPEVDAIMDRHYAKQPVYLVRKGEIFVQTTKYSSEQYALGLKEEHPESAAHVRNVWAGLQASQPYAAVVFRLDETGLPSFAGALADSPDAGSTVS